MTITTPSLDAGRCLLPVRFCHPGATKGDGMRFIGLIGLIVLAFVLATSRKVSSSPTSMAYHFWKTIASFQLLV